MGLIVHSAAGKSLAAYTTSAYMTKTQLAMTEMSAVMPGNSSVIRLYSNILDVYMQMGLQ